MVDNPTNAERRTDYGDRADGPTMKAIGDKLAQLGNEIHGVKRDMATTGDATSARLEEVEAQIDDLRKWIRGIHGVLMDMVRMQEAQ